MDNLEGLALAGREVILGVGVLTTRPASNWDLDASAGVVGLYFEACRPKTGKGDGGSGSTLGCVSIGSDGSRLRMIWGWCTDRSRTQFHLDENVCVGYVIDP